MGIAKARHRTVIEVGLSSLFKVALPATLIASHTGANKQRNHPVFRRYILNG